MKLSTKVSEAIETNEGSIFVSQISLWQIAIKHKIGKLPGFKVSLAQFIETIETDGFSILPLPHEHLTAYFNCTFFHPDHKDPFDRLLIATADFEKMAFITKDEKFDAYKNTVNIVW